jgi:hypothetical protein
VPFRSKETLQGWVSEFLQQGYTVVSDLDVLTHDGGAGEDTGLIVMRMKNSTTELYLQPIGPYDPHWELIFEPRADANRATLAQLVGLTEELMVASTLLAFLEGRSRGHIDAHNLEHGAAPSD